MLTMKLNKEDMYKSKPSSKGPCGYNQEQILAYATGKPIRGLILLVSQK